MKTNLINKLKSLQLYLHHNYRTIRKWMLVIIGVLLVIISSALFVSQNRLVGQIAFLAEQNKVLSEQNIRLNEQTKSLGEANQSIAKQNRSYSRCIATIFAQYTHDFVPVTITNLDTCTTDSQTKATNNTPTNGTAPGQSKALPPSSNPAQGHQAMLPPEPPTPLLLPPGQGLIRDSVPGIGGL